MKSQELRKIAPELDPLRIGTGWKVEELEKMQIFIGSTYGDSHPGSVHLNELVGYVEESLQAVNAKGAKYYTTDICDGEAQGHDGINYSLCSREMTVSYTHLDVYKRQVLGPSMLNIMSETSDFMRLLTFVGDAGFYFFPIYVAYAAAKKFQTNIPMALFIAGVLLHPTLIEIVNTGEAFTVYGIPMYLTTYSSNFVSMILIVWMMSYVEKGLNKVIPNALRALLFPLLTLLIMLPIALCILGPIGAILGKGIADGLVSLHTLVGPFSIAIIAACWPLLIVTGMHQALIAIALTYIATMGFDNSILVGAFISNYPMIAIGLTYLMKSKGAEEKGNALTSFVTLTIGGISEPTLFGIILRYKKAILYMLAGGFAGGFYAGLMNVAVYFVGSGNIAIALGFAGENANSLPQGIIACVIAFVLTLSLAMIFGFDDKKEGRNNDSVISTK